LFKQFKKNPEDSFFFSAGCIFPVSGPLDIPPVGTDIPFEAV
jgi:hypothetical protein